MRLTIRAGVSHLNGYAAAWETVNRIVTETDGLNLDRRQAVISLMQSLAGCVSK